MVGFTNVRQKHIYNTYGVNKQGQKEIINHAVKHIKKKTNKAKQWVGGV